MLKNLFKVFVAALILTAVGCDISGKIIDKNGNPMAGVTVTLTGADDQVTTTDQNGRYAFNDLSQGSYTVIPALEDTFFSPEAKNVKLSLSNVTVNFTQIIPPEPPATPQFDLTGTFLFRVVSPIAQSMGGGVVIIQAYVEQTGNKFTMELVDYDSVVITGAIDGAQYTALSFPDSWMEMSFGDVLIDVKFKSMIFTAIDEDSVEGEVSITGKYMEIPVNDRNVVIEGYRY